MADAQYCFPTSGSLKHRSSNMCNSYCISCHSYGHPTLAWIAQSKPKKPCWSSTSYYSAWLLSQPYQFLKRAPAPALRDLSRLSQMPLPPSNQSIPVHLNKDCRSNHLAHTASKVSDLIRTFHLQLLWCFFNDSKEDGALNHYKHFTAKHPDLL